MIVFDEPEDCDYIFIDNDNRVHLLLPIIGGQEIAIDNTCESARELQTFFGTNSNSAENILRRYKDRLLNDISAIQSQKGISRCAYQDLMREKKQRLEQIEKYINLIGEIKDNYNTGINRLFTVGIPELPSTIHKIIKSANNAFVVRLSPHHPDPFTKFYDPLFSLMRNRSRYAIWGFKALTKGLGARLRSAFQPEDSTPLLINRKSPKEQVIQKVLSAIEDKNMNVPVEAREKKLNDLKIIIQNELVKIIPEITSLEKNRSGQTMDLNFMELMGINEHDVIEEWINTLIDSSLDPITWENPELCEILLGVENKGSVFYDPADKGISPEQLAELMSIRVQYLLAEINIYCKKNELSKANFGKFFDKEPHATQISRLVKEGLAQGQDIEPIIYGYVNNHLAALGLKTSLAVTQQAHITKKFTDNYRVIRDSPHFDEFLVIDPDKKGAIFSYKSRISCHFLDFFTLQTKGKYPLGDFENHAEALKSGTSNRLHHKNHIVSEGYETIKIFREEVIKLLAENKPNELLAFLIAKSPYGVPNYSMLSLETQNYISYNRNWPFIEQELLNTTTILANEKQDLLKLLSPNNVNRENLSAIVWSKYSSKLLFEVELNKVADGLIRMVHVYNKKRSRQWYKGFRDEVRIKQCEVLMQVGQEINSLLDCHPLSKEQILEKIVQSIETLNRINNEISLETSNRFQSTLQQEIKIFQAKLITLCELDSYEFISMNINMKIEEQLDKIRDPAVKDIVKTLPAHYHTDEGIMLFNTLNLEESMKVASYLNIEYRDLDRAVDKKTLLEHDIPLLFKEINLQLLLQLKEDASISQEVFERFIKLADTIPPELMTRKNIKAWSHAEVSEESDPAKLLAKVKETKPIDKLKFFNREPEKRPDDEPKSSAPQIGPFQ
ncbi:protein SdcA [Legionella antarctica]|uniref:Protein SdcA n=1 Tax=Legionella antarctica TaxID=2708020 RepID=A0A6F8T7U5_9GAMM|nr:protein SdcA [Legionella antarctica]BCA96036.1 protein SdcA [Legionella antarctica]